MLIWYGNYLQKIGETDSLLRIFEAISDTDSLNQIILCDLLINIYGKLCFFIIFLAIQGIDYLDVDVDVFVHRQNVKLQRSLRSVEQNACEKYQVRQTVETSFYSVAGIE